MCESKSEILKFDFLYLSLKKIFSVTLNEFSPEILKTEIPPSPAGVDIAAIVSFQFILIILPISFS